MLDRYYRLSSFYIFQSTARYDVVEMFEDSWLARFWLDLAICGDPVFVMIDDPTSLLITTLRCCPLFSPKDYVVYKSAPRGQGEIVGLKSPDFCNSVVLLLWQSKFEKKNLWYPLGIESVEKMFLTDLQLSHVMSNSSLFLAI